MTFNPDPNKQAQEIFFRETKNISHPPLKFSNNSDQQVQFQKHLGVYLDGKLDFREHNQKMFKKQTKQSVYYVKYKITYLELHYKTTS